MSVQNIYTALDRIGEKTKTSELQKTCQELSKSRKPIHEVVKNLSEYILNVDDANLFKNYFSNILLALVSAKIPLKPVFSNVNYDSCSDEEKKCHLDYSIILAELSDHPDVLQYALKYFDINKVPPFEVFIHHEDSYNVAPKKRRLLDYRHKITDQQMVESCYKLLVKLPNELAAKWDWNTFVNNFSNNENAEIRWLVKECMAILTNMTQAQTKTLSQNLNTTNQDMLRCITALKKDTVRTMIEIIEDEDLSKDSVVNIDGILLPVYDKSNMQEGNLVSVKSTVNNLRSLALAVASGKALSLMGPVGSGKTSLVEHLAAITGRKGIAFKKVQLGDQTDSRMLLGGHQCTDVPGEFVWRPGVLTEAVQNGHWLLLEDIDTAALDVASTLSSLLERNALCVPGYRDTLPVTPGFQLFVTQRTLATNYGFQKKMSNSSTLLQKHLTQINVEPLSRSELSEIIQTLYPSLSTICTRMLEVFMMFSVGSHDTSLQSSESSTEKSMNIIRGSRLISTRDLMKWCSRSILGFNVSSPDSALKVLQDALDIFTCSVASPEHRLELAKKVGTCLGVVETKSEFYCKHYKPNVSLNATALEVGRAKVARVEKSLESIDFDNKQVVFSFTRQSACLLERIACCVTSNEPVLLVGETGTGKTSSVQYLARQTGHKLIVINMNQQSDSADLLGGYKPVDLKYVIRPIRHEFEKLFKSFYNVEKNSKFLGHIETCYETENWTALLALMKQSHKAALNRLTSEKKEKKLRQWLSFGHKLAKLDQQVKAASRLTFAFIEGSLVKAMQDGHWVLLDEINLASAEILECLAGLLEDKSESIDLLEKGDKVPIQRHPDFTLFACMNPATDVGKKDLPVGLRNRFTEFFIDELTERNDLMLLIGDYLYHMNLDGVILEAIFSFYTSIRKEAKLSLVDGAGNTPHYSLRTLCRALTAAAKAKCGTVARSLYEAFCLSFLTQLDSSSHPVVEAMIAKAVIGKKHLKSVLNQLIPEPQVRGQNFLLFEGHWIPQGKLDINIPEGYILTPTVRKNLRDIARIISLGRLPVLLQGDTSVGKTSLITYIAKASGNYCVRINNHEHTDLQEYIGSYATDASGKLVFKEGVLVEAMRKGYWIILDELNLAPSDVLEALNRVLDDNRELFIPETQQVVKADPNFMLFATQNPPGLYGGRKMLSRAFRNRFVELHFDEIPKNELETILHQRCHVPPAYSKKMINVMADLQIRRRGSAAVQGKDGFITLRDLFRWGQRYKHASKETLTDDKFYDWDQHIADEGYLILAGKVRQPDERTIIEEVIEKHIKRKVKTKDLFCLHQATSPVTKNILEIILNNQLEEFSHVVWTYNMRRLAVLIAKAFTFDEPVLLVGETGCGKTTICQVLAALKQRQLFSVNCHMHTESSDFLGGLRPVRQYKNDGRLFEWVDGPLIKAMESGNMFLADEISLADDSVLERLNSLLEPERQLVLAERGMEDNSDIVVITAEKNFHFVGTMNPGGDFGKKELSPALRNRFTEIWCDSVSSREDLLKVLEKSVNKGISLGNQEDGGSGIGNSILDFTEWLKDSEVTNKFPFSIRDLLSWVQFVNTTVVKRLLDTPEAYVHGACMTFLDCFGTALTGHIDPDTLVVLRASAINFLLNQIKTVGNECTENLREMLSNKRTAFAAECDDTKFGIKPFYIEVGQHVDISDCEGTEQRFTFTAPTTGSNTLRLLRGMQLNKAILLEGNPGVGKTSLVTALARSSGHKVIRINLSDQTDITDLFGTDLPTEDGSFTFKEGTFLTALQNGDWILLDELNLAPQPVLEGLNACLDHRGEVFIPELGKTFKVKQQTKLFACQNPLKQGGARRGLPLSFLNRFTQVYIDVLTKEDLLYIVESQYPSISKDILQRIVKFNCKVAHEITEIQSWAHRGSPWEMNLRDIQRWCEAIIQDQNEGDNPSPGKFVDILYVNRMRTAEDKERMIRTYDEFFSPDYPRSASIPQFLINESKIIFGDVVLERQLEKSFKNRRATETNLLILRNQLPTLKALAQGIKMNWLSILVGPTFTGKSSIVQVLADLTGNELQVVPVTSAMDVSDLLGGFEQVDYNRNLENIYDKIETLTIETVRNMWVSKNHKEWNTNKLLSNLYEYKNLTTLGDASNLKKFHEKIQYQVRHCENLVKCNEPFSSVSTKLQEVLTSLKKLESRVTNAISVNAGGKFEWVDSLLVKTMIEGSWLLLDNVNLTSAAVLDRLNGLLEPNGVLSIPERGDCNEIAPHPNFRVFFTMDPKYGEISRAMRNRGIETFLLRPDDFNTLLSDTMSNMDLTALLSSCGLPNRFHQPCITLHDMMTSYIQGLERPSISQLLQAAHLLTQQLVRGISAEAAINNSFTDVYIKPRCGADFANPNMSLAEMKNKMLIAIQKQAYSICLYCNYNKDLNNTAHTLTVKGLCTNSEFEIARKIAFIAAQESLNSYENSKPFLHAFLCVFNAYTNCPKHLLQLCYSVVNDSLTNQTTSSINSLTMKLNKNAFRHLEKCSEVECYKRFYSESYEQDELSIKEANTRAVLLFNCLLKVMTESTLSKDSFSVLDYSGAVASGRLTDDFAEYPILKQCQNYLKIIDNHVVSSITEARDSLDDEVTCRVLQLLNWRSRFFKLASEDIFVTSGSRKRPQLREDIVPLLNIHHKWLQKHLVQELFKLLPENHYLINQFSSIINDVLFLKDRTKRDEEIESKLLKLSKKLRKICGQPKLYKTKDEYSLCVRRSEVYKNLTFNTDGAVSKQLDKLSMDVATVTDISLAKDIPDENRLTIIDENLAKIDRNATMSHTAISELKLLPLTSYVLQRILAMMQTDFLDIVSELTSEDASSKKNVKVTEVLNSFVALCKMSKGFPPAFLNLLELVQNILENGHNIQRVSSVPVKFWDEFYKAVVNSPAFHPLPFLQLEENLTSEEPNSDVLVSSKRLSSNLPLLPYYVQKLTVSTDASESRMLLAYETVSLVNRANYSIQLGSVSNILWKNIAILDTAATLKLKSDAKFELKKFEQLSYYLRSIITARNLNEDNGKRDKDLVKETYSCLDEYFKGHTAFVTTFETAMTVYNSTKALFSQSSVYCRRLMKLMTAELSILTATLFTGAMSNVNSVDQVERYRLKVQYIEEDVKMFEALLSTYYFHGLVTGTVTDTKTIEKASEVYEEFYSTEDSKEALKRVHPYCGIILDLKEQTANKILKYALGNTFRPEEPSYNSFAKDCKHFSKSVLSHSATGFYIGDTIMSLLKKMYHTARQNKPYTQLLTEAETVVRETSTRTYSIYAFYKKVESTYSEAFPDLAKPLLRSLSQMIHSLTLVNDLIKEEILTKGESPPHLTHIVKYLMTYPSLNIDEFEKIDSNSSYSTDGLLKLYLNASCDDKDTAEMDIITVLKTQLMKIKMRCTAKDSVEKRAVNSMLSALNQLVKYWELQQREIERKKQDDEALYVTKSKCEDEDEEAMANEEIQEMFPSYSDHDFADFKPPTLEQKPVKKQNTDLKKTKLLMLPEDVSLVYKWHSSFVRNMTSAEWLPARKKLVGNDVISVLIQMYPIFSRIIERRWEALDADLEGDLTPSLLVLVSQIKAKVDGNDSSSNKIDFYRSAWVSETRQCLPLLQKVTETTNEMLDQWPDFPTLKEIVVIVNRILAFPITSPISRFLTGLELLRDKIEEWNKNAHKGNNMIEVSLTVGQQIINWRKLEMAHWKECLNNLYQRLQSEAHKYWFFMYAVIKTYLEPDTAGEGSAVPADRVIAVLKDFMEKSNLAEYEVRLDIIYIYHCHLVHLESTQRRDELLSILWNMYNYYSQFSAQVASHIKEKRAPIEKKLKDFVKICTWDRDLSYWSVKDTVEKAHKALHKHTKEFEKVLKESVTNCLVDNSTDVSGDVHVGIWDRPKRATNAAAPSGGAYMIDVANHIVLARNVKKYMDEAEEPSKILPENGLLAKVTNLLNKAKTLCKDTITNTGYPSLVQGLDDFITLVIETSNHLGSLEIDASSPKEKQTSQAKNIIQQKRKSLADLFKYLHKMGLNYRTGLVILSASEHELHDFTIPPVDLEAAISYLKSRRCDASLALLWSGCEKYFQKNIARHRLLSTALLTPHQDLGIPNIERCKGFAAQLVQLTNTQKKSISKYSRRLCDLRTLSTNLTNALEIDSTDANISTLNQKLDLLNDCYAKTSVTLEQFGVLLKSLPEKGISADYEADFDAVLSDSKIVSCYKNTNEWKDLNKRLNGLITNVNKQKNALHKLASVNPKKLSQNKDVLAISQSHIDVAVDAKENIETMIESVEEIVNEYNFKFKTLISDYEPKHPILRSIINLSQYLKEVLNQIEKLDESNDVSMAISSEDLVNQTEDLVATMLLIIQSVYKKHLPQEKENIEVINAIDEIILSGEKPPEEPKDILEDKHLKELLQEKLTGDTRMLQLDALTNKLSNLLSNYVDYLASNKNVQEVRSVAMRLVPILEQTVLFVQYFVTQKVAVHRVSCKMLSVLLKIFADLATKGFCKPSGLEMEEGDGEGGPGKLSGGTGLGDGEGQKDVSDKIENQDQLDDAQRPGEEKNEEERDCKEEEKGVNMTDDFDSHLQDVEKKEGDDSDQEDDENDADKQMGDTNNAAEKLDQQIWGSEDEEEPEEGDKKDKEDKGKGESTGEKEMAAKEQEQGTDDGEEGKDKKEKKDINEMEEPEVDDDHVDPYHGNHPQYPEPEDFELPDNMDVDEEGNEKEPEGETESENPFEIDVMKDMPEETDPEKDNEENRNGLDVSSDEENGQDGDKDGGDQEDKEDSEQPDNKTGEDDNKSGEETENTEAKEDDKMEEDTAENAEPEIDDQDENEMENENLPKNNEDIDKEDEVEEKSHEANPQANPSSNDPSAQDRAENAQMERGTNDNVETNDEQAKDEEAAPYEQAQEQVGEDKQSMGRAELDKSETGHRGEKQAASKTDSTREKQKKYENKPGNTDQQRTLGEINEEKQKQAQTLNVEKEDDDASDGADGDNQEKEADAFQHVKQANKDDLQAVDAATKEQAEEQPVQQKDEEENGEKLKEDEEVPMEVDDEDIQVEKSEEIKSEKLKEGVEKDKEKSGNKKDGGDDPTGETGIEVEGENVLTETVPRGIETSYHTRLDTTSIQTEEMTVDQYMSIREWLSSKPTQGGISAGVWRSLWQQSGGAARALCERLRLVLEPTMSSRRAGDFRTGRAINMRRVIPYIASHFRKDRIWLRRTKPAKREYKIAIAVDDSSSMADNRSKELAFESLALVSQALNLLESGDLAVLSFGEKPNLLHPFTEQFSEHSGSKILEQLQFNQTKTKIAQLLDFCCVMFEEQTIRSDAPNAKLLVIVGDGRNIFAEGEKTVLQAVRRARQQGIFLVYVVVDNPENRDSIMDIRKPVMDSVTNKLSFITYLDAFPFPFYLILRDMTALPNVLGDALRQWFELAANTS